MSIGKCGVVRENYWPHFNRRAGYFGMDFISDVLYAINAPYAITMQIVRTQISRSTGSCQGYPNFAYGESSDDGGTDARTCGWRPREIPAMHLDAIRRCSSLNFTQRCVLEDDGQINESHTPFDSLNELGQRGSLAA